MAVATALDVAAPRDPRRLRAAMLRYPVFAGAFAVGVGVIVEIGWIGGIRELARPIHELPAMTAGSALMAILAGGALWLRSTWAFGPRTRITPLCAGVLLALAGLTLIEHAAGLHLISRLIDGELAETELRPPVGSALAFLLLGIALLTIHPARRTGHRVGDVLALAAASIAASALLGYLFGVPILYGQRAAWPIAGVSWQTALVVLAVANGVLAAHSDDGLISIVLARDAGGLAARHLLVGLALLPPLAFIVVIGARIGWYAMPIASAVFVLLVLAEGSVFALLTAHRLSAANATELRLLSALRASEERARLLLEEASEAIFVADLDGRYIEVNSAACRLLGYERDELLRMSIANLLSADAVPRLEIERRDVVAGRAPVGEWELRRRDGSFVSVEVSAKLLPDGRWEAFVRDITERRRAARVIAEASARERDLRADLEAVRRASAAVSEAVAGLSSASIDDVFAQIAQQARELTGAELAAVGVGTDPDRPFDPWITSGMPDEAAQAIGRNPRPIGVLGHVIQHPHPLRIADVMKHPQFRGLPAPHPPIRSFLAIPIIHRGHAVGNIYLANKQTAVEFTERDERLARMLADGIAVAITIASSYAAEATRRSWFQSIIDQLPQGVIVLDAAGRVEAINRTMASWSSSHLARDVGTLDQFDVRDPSGRPVPIDQRPLARVLRTSQPTGDEEYALVQPDGHWLPVTSSAVPIRTDGKLTGAVVVATDISERKEEERQREEWIAVVAHDLRQPINLIVLSIDMLLSRLLEPNDRSNLERMRDTAWRLNRMIEDLLDAARIAADRLTIDRKPVDIVALVATSIEQASLANPGIEIQLQAPAHQFAWIDADRIQQVVSNLLSNAVKYRAGGTPIAVEIRRDTAGVTVDVRNEGAAIDPEELRRLFTRFTRTRDARASGRPGIGLGLYISKGIVESHGGRIWAESTAGQTRFCFTIPDPATAERAGPDPEHGMA